MNYLRGARAGVNTTTLVRDMSNGATNLPLWRGGKFWTPRAIEGSNFIDQLAASVVGRREGGSMARKGVVKERLLRIVSVTTQTGRHFEEDVEIQAPAKGSPGSKKGQGGSG